MVSTQMAGSSHFLASNLVSHSCVFNAMTFGSTSGLESWMAFTQDLHRIICSGMAKVLFPARQLANKSSGTGAGVTAPSHSVLHESTSFGLANCVQQASQNCMPSKVDGFKLSVNHLSLACFLVVVKHAS